MDTESWLSDTRRVSSYGNTQIGVMIRREIAEALGITKGSLVEIKVRNTGKMARAVREDLKKTMRVAEETVKQIGAKGVIFDNDIAKVSVVGIGMRSHSGVASDMFSALAKEGINIEMISTSEIKISCVLEKRYADKAVRAIHRRFRLGNK